MRLEVYMLTVMNNLKTRIKELEEELASRIEYSISLDKKIEERREREREQRERIEQLEARLAEVEKGIVEKELILNNEDEDVEEQILDVHVNKQLKNKTLAQTKIAKQSADILNKQLSESIETLESTLSTRSNGTAFSNTDNEEEEKVIWDEPLEEQFTKIFGVEYTGERMSVEQYYEIVVPVLKKMDRSSIDFFYLHYNEVIPNGYKYKYYF